jgi:hypothetical protein
MWEGFLGDKNMTGGSLSCGLGKSVGFNAVQVLFLIHACVAERRGCRELATCDWIRSLGTNGAG